MSSGDSASGKRGVAEALRQELRRGTLVLAVLTVLRTEGNGSAVRERLASGGVEIDEGALYPMLRRLEDQRLLRSEWRLEDSRRKRFYLLSQAGEDTLISLLNEWRNQTTALTALSGRMSNESGR
jgi:PadR family transcriptional regulator, regulatory protein PadR